MPSEQVFGMIWDRFNAILYSQPREPAEFSRGASLIDLKQAAFDLMVGFSERCVGANYGLWPDGADPRVAEPLLTGPITLLLSTPALDPLPAPAPPVEAQRTFPSSTITRGSGQVMVQAARKNEGHDVGVSVGTIDPALVQLLGDQGVDVTDCVNLVGVGGPPKLLGVTQEGHAVLNVRMIVPADILRLLTDPSDATRETWAHAIVCSPTVSLLIRKAALNQAVLPQ